MTTNLSIPDSLTPEMKAQIEALLAQHEVCLFMKGTPQMPQCGFSGQLVQMLSYLGVPFVGINVLEDDGLRQGIKVFSDWPTVPQLYVKGEFVGGCDIVRDLFQTNELRPLLETRGIALQTQRE